MVYEVKNGFCPMCGSQFFDICEACKRPGKPLPNHRQFKARLSNGNEAYVGVCAICLPNVTLADANAIWDGIKNYDTDIDRGLSVVGMEFENGQA